MAVGSKVSSTESLHTEALKFDPAVEHWNFMRNSTHLYYRLNRNKIIPTFITLIVVPGLMFYGMMKSYVRNILYSYI